MTNSVFKSSGSPTPNSVSVASDKAKDKEWNRSLGREETTDEVSAVKQAEVVKREMISTSNQKAIDKLKVISSLDWKNIPPPVLAEVLIQIPFKGSGTDPDYYLAPFQAIIFALRCFELGLSPFSNEVWFNPKNNKVNLTFEGKLKLARMQGMNLSPPVFTRIPADATKPLVAYKAEITAPRGKSEYTAYLRDWQVSSSPVWKSKPEHMLQLRAAEKCLSFATGSGASELPDERDLETGTEVKQILPEITVTGGNQ